MYMSLNAHIAMKLQEMSDLLNQQGANPFRVKAYRNAALTLAEAGQDVGEILEQQGVQGLEAMPGIGHGIAAAIVEMIDTGHWSQLERLRGSLDPVRLFQTVPGIGRELATRIHDELHADTLEALEEAAYDGRLEKIRGVGTRRLAALRASLSAMLQRRRWQRPFSPKEGPPVSMLLEVDHDYRVRAEAGELTTIAPRRFNPEGGSWLPVMHLEEANWHFTAMFSNTARAHQLHKTSDWVVIYCYDAHHHEGQYTIVTETHGRLLGRRVVRGREAECRRFYDL